MTTAAITSTGARGLAHAAVVFALASAASVMTPWATARPAPVATRAEQNAEPTQVVADAQLQSCARAELSAWLGSQHARFEIEPITTPAALALPMGRVEMRARPIGEKQALGPRMQVWVDVSVDGRFVRTQPVSLTVHAYRSAWVATEDLGVGRDVPSAPFENREIDIAAARALPIEGPLPSARLRLRVLKGEPLTAAGIERLPAVQRGGSVTLRARLGEIGIESRGEALQDGQPGQRIWVKVATSTGPLLARVVGDGLVEMQP